MMSEPTITIEIDPAADAAYVALGESQVTRTVEFSPAIAVDLDSLDVVVGIELLTLAAGVTAAEAVELGRQFHVPTVFEVALPMAFEAVTQWAATRAIEPPSSPRRSDFGAIRPAKTATLEECSGC